MKGIQSYFLLLAMTCLGLCNVANAAIGSLKVTDDTRSLFHILSFGFDAGGEARVNVTGFDTTNKKSKPAVGFVLVKTNSEVGTDQLLQQLREKQMCLFGVNMDMHQILMGNEKTNVKSKAQKSFKIVDSGYYSLIYQNCGVKRDQSQVVKNTFQVDTAMYNLNDDGSRDYLPAGERPLPTIFFVVSCIFGAMTVVWVMHLRRHSDKIHKIHHLMTALVAFKCLSVLFEGVRYHFIRTLGHPTGWSVVYYSLNFIRGMLFFTVILLVGMGWSMLKPFLNDREKKIMLVVLPLQLLVNIAIIVAGEAAPGSLSSIRWSDLLHLADFICCLLIILPIMWSIRQIRIASAADGKAQHTLDRLTQFRSFYLYTVSYLYFTRIIVYLLGASLPHEKYFIAPLLSEVASIAYYIGTGWRFRPASDNPYVRVRSDSDDDEDEEFGLNDDPDIDAESQTIEMAGGLKRSSGHAQGENAGAE